MNSETWMLVWGLALAMLAGGAWPQEGAQAGAQSSQNGTQSSQQASPAQATEPKIAVDVKSVSVAATVRDKHGKIISNLSKDDFAIEEDGRAQTINYFARESDLPLRLGLLVDTSLSQRRVLGEQRSASYSFLDHLLRENKDLAFVIHFDKEVELLEDFTGSGPKLQAALQSLQTPQMEVDNGNGGGGQNGGGGGLGGGRRGAGGGGGSRGSGRRSGGTLLYDAIYLAGDEEMSERDWRAVVRGVEEGEGGEDLRAD